MTAPYEHQSIEALADLAADVLDPGPAADVRAHVDVCPDCRSTYDLVVALPGVLAGAPVPTIPDGVAARVGAAIEREHIARVVEAERADTRVAGRTPARSAARASARPRWSARFGAGLLGAAAVLGGGYLVLDSQLISGGGEDGPESAVQDDAGITLEEHDSAAEEPLAQAEAGTYTAATLDDAVRELVGNAAGGWVDTSRSPGTVLGDNGDVGEPDDVAVKAAACIAAAQQEASSDAQKSATLLAVDAGTYDGEPAVVVVLAGPTLTSDTVPLDVWVLDSSCLADSAPADSGSSLDDTDADGDGSDFSGSTEPDVLAHRTVRP